MKTSSGSDQGSTDAHRKCNGTDEIRSTSITDALLTASRLLVAISARSIAQVDETITIPQFRTSGDLVQPGVR